MNYLQGVPWGLLLVFFEGQAFWAATAWPVSRLPVFIMGMLAGIQELRYREDPDGFLDPNVNQIFLHDWIPWGFCWTKKQLENAKPTKERTERIWRRRVDLNTFLITFLIVLTIAGEVPGFWTNKLNTFGQVMLVHMMLMVIAGLARDGGRSFLGRLCRSTIVQFLGTISMTLYLLHLDFPRYFLIGINGLYPEEANGTCIEFGKVMAERNLSWVPEDWPELLEINSCIHPWYYNKAIEVGMIPLFMLATPAAAWIIHYYFEEPMRRLLRAKPATKIEPLQA